MFIFSNADETASTRRFLYPNLCVESLRQCELIPIMQFYPKNCYTSRKTKAAGLPPYRLTFIFCQRRQHGCRRAFSLLESVHRIAPPASSLFEKLLHSRKAKRYSFHPYRLMFIFSQRRRHDCHMAFSLPEFVRRIAPPMRTHGR